jgi:hypothetical protein
VLASAVTVPWLLLSPTGTALVVAPLGFEQTLVRVDTLSRPAAVFGAVATLGVASLAATGALGARTGREATGTRFELETALAAVAAVGLALLLAVAG